jgi:hypothetical protein
LIAGLWDTIVAADSLGAARQTTSAFQSVWAIRAAVFLVAVDIVSGCAGVLLLGAGFVVYLVIPVACKSRTSHAL